MIDVVVVTGCLLASVAGTIWLLRRGGIRNSLAIVAAFFVFFSLGPVVNLLRGDEIYFGTDLNHVAGASIGYAIGVGAMCIADLLYP
ncbi:hypothetical protein, partial [Georgenia sp. Z1491]|uniref:hypothetical protein n=1 Tax=Georgenia sp. Z1491 TaxID=3416707 RepID=UPI003CF88C26